MRLTLLMTCLIMLFACTKDIVPEEKCDTNIQLRVENASTYEFDDVTIWVNGQNELYGGLSAGQTSTYKSVSDAYGYAPMNITINGVTTNYDIYDYVGEEMLCAGNYTYVMEVVDTTNLTVGVTCRQD